MVVPIITAREKPIPWAILIMIIAHDKPLINKYKAKVQTRITRPARNSVIWLRHLTKRPVNAAIIIINALSILLEKPMYFSDAPRPFKNTGKSIKRELPKKNKRLASAIL
jgi:hypothetical protein